MRSAFLVDQKVMYNLLMKTVAESVMELARDPRFVGGTPGILMVLHTWTGQLHYHPHVHLLVTAGGISDGGEHWRDPRNKDFLVSVKALSKMIRRRFREALQKLEPEVFASLPAQTWINGWNTFCKPYGNGVETVLQYLARYVFRIAITNSRVVNLDDGHITFRYKDRATNQWRHCTLDDFAFLDRLLQHVLPKGFHKVRYYGLWHHSKKAQQQARRLLELKAPKSKETQPADIGQLAPEAEALANQHEPKICETGFQPTCPRCGCERVTGIEELKRRRHSGATPRAGASP